MGINLGSQLFWCLLTHFLCAGVMFEEEPPPKTDRGGAWKAQEHVKVKRRPSSVFHVVKGGKGKQCTMGFRIISSCKSYEDCRTWGDKGRCSAVGWKFQQHLELASCCDGEAGDPSEKRGRHTFTYPKPMQCWCREIQLSEKCISACTVNFKGAHKQGCRDWWCR